MVDEKEWNNFITDCKIYKEKVDNLLSTTKEQEQRITQLEMNSMKTDTQYNEIMKTLNKLIDVTIPELSKEIQEIKSKPAERYNQVTTVIITTIVGGIIGYIIKFFT